MEKDSQKIFIVEDDKLLADLLTKRLRDDGFDVNFASSGEEFFDILKNKMPNLIILDLLLPGKGGLEILSQIKTKESVKNIPVILLSNLQPEEEIEKAEELGSVSFISKSKADLETIVRKIKEVLNI